MCCFAFRTLEGIFTPHELNKRHPDLREGEVFLTNASDDLSRLEIFDEKEVDCRSSREATGWKTKRRG